MRGYRETFWERDKFHGIQHIDIQQQPQSQILQQPQPRPQQVQIQQQQHRQQVQNQQLQQQVQNQQLQPPVQNQQLQLPVQNQLLQQQVQNQQRQQYQTLQLEQQQQNQQQHQRQQQQHFQLQQLQHHINKQLLEQRLHHQRQQQQQHQQQHKQQNHQVEQQLQQRQQEQRQQHQQTLQNLQQQHQQQEQQFIHKQQQKLQNIKQEFRLQKEFLRPSLLPSQPPLRPQFPPVQIPVSYSQRDFYPVYTNIVYPFTPKTNHFALTKNNTKLVKRDFSEGHKDGCRDDRPENKIKEFPKACNDIQTNKKEDENSHSHKKDLTDHKKDLPSFDLIEHVKESPNSKVDTGCQTENSTDYSNVEKDCISTHQKEDKKRISEHKKAVQKGNHHKHHSGRNNLSKDSMNNHNDLREDRFPKRDKDNRKEKHKSYRKDKYSCHPKDEYSRERKYSYSSDQKEYYLRESNDYYQRERKGSFVQVGRDDFSFPGDDDFPSSLKGNRRDDFSLDYKYQYSEHWTDDYPKRKRDNSPFHGENNYNTDRENEQYRHHKYRQTIEHLPKYQRDTFSGSEEIQEQGDHHYLGDYYEYPRDDHKHSKSSRF